MKQNKKEFQKLQYAKKSPQKGLNTETNETKAEEKGKESN